MVQLTRAQARKLLKHKAVQLKPEQLHSGGALPKDMPMRLQKQIARAMKHNKGMRMRLEPSELVEGSGFLDWLKSLGNMIKTPLKILAPVIKPLAKEIGAPIVSKYTGIPTDVLKQGVDVTANLAGVGLPRGRGRRASAMADNSSMMIAPVHPVFASQPQFTGHDVRRIIKHSTQGGGIMMDSKQFQNVYTSKVIPDMTSGVGFKAAGYGRMK